MDIRGQINTYIWDIYLKDRLIYDWGSSNRPVSRHLQHENCKFVTIDRRAERHPDLVLDFDEIVFLEQADTAFCIEVLEHSRYPDVVIKNIYYALKPGGELIITVPFICALHGRDYWRFTSFGIKQLLQSHGFKIIDFVEMEHEGRVGFLVRAEK